MAHQERNTSTEDNDLVSTRNEALDYFGSITDRIHLPTRLSPNIPILPRTIGTGYGDMCFEVNAKFSKGPKRRTEEFAEQKKRSCALLTRLGLDVAE